MVKVYRKTATIKAEQFDGSQTSLFGYEVMPDSLLDALTGEPAYYSILIDDFEPEPDDFPDDNEVSFEIGDWVVNETDEIKVMADEEFKQQYAELPVISKVYGDTIEEFKAYHYKLSEMFNDWDWNYGEQELIARAWLDGYQVEEDK
ncbi:prophage protein [Lactiplantibacillus plantarum]|nr:prophage protein [Lactiplantibacillus plantarum]